MPASKKSVDATKNGSNGKSVSADADSTAAARTRNGRAGTKTRTRSRSKNGSSTASRKSTSNSAAEINSEEKALLTGDPDREYVGKLTLSQEDIDALNTRRGVVKLLKSRNVKLKKIIDEVTYEEELNNLQIELIKLQRWVQETGQRVAILFEGRDAAGKGGTIRRFTEHMNPRALRIVALPKPTETEMGQWYFQRYSKQLPNAGEIVFFDRSWYNRAVVEPVNGFCSNLEYKRFIRQVPEFEHMLYESGISIIKFWFSISKEEQKARFDSRRINPLKQWKLSPIDKRAQELWDKYTAYKEDMFSKTHTSFSPWIIVKANSKKVARLESIRYVLDRFEYEGKSDSNTRIFPDPNIVTRFHRSINHID